MCDTCGCSDNNNVSITTFDKKKERLIIVEENVLEKNNSIAKQNRNFLQKNNILTFNLMSSPGSGKTTLLEKTIIDLKNTLKFYVIEGDQNTINDAKRIQATGVPVVQINTGAGCHLDADMINNAIQSIKPKNNSILMIENVGNLVCPSMFDLGETKKIVIISTTEGEDKPIKYPSMFQNADICIINKIDLMPYLDFNIKQCKEYASKVNHHLEFFELSAKNGDGIDKWYSFIKNNALKLCK